MKKSTAIINGQEFGISDIDMEPDILPGWSCEQKTEVQEFAEYMVSKGLFETAEDVLLAMFCLPIKFNSKIEAEDVWSKALGCKCTLDGENIIIGEKL